MYFIRLALGACSRPSCSRTIERKLANLNLFFLLIPLPAKSKFCISCCRVIDTQPWAIWEDIFTAWRSIYSLYTSLWSLSFRVNVLKTAIYFNMKFYVCWFIQCNEQCVQVNVTSLATSRRCKTVIESMDDSISYRVQYPDNPVFDSDHQQLMAVSNKWIGDCLGDNQTEDLSWRLTEMNSLFVAAEHLFTKSFLIYWNKNTFSRWV